MEKIKLEKYCVNKIDNVPAKDDYDIDYIDISSVDNVLKKVIGYSTYNIAEAPSRAKQILEKNDILVSTVRPNLNAVALCNIETENLLVGSTGFCVLRGNDKVNNKYLFYFCQSGHFVGELMKVATGASYPAVSKNDVKNVLIPKYQIEKQNEIVETLDKVSGIISYRKEQLKLLDDLIKSRFIEMFGEPISNPKGWEKNRLGSECNIVTGNTPSRNVDEYYGDYIEWIKSDNISSSSEHLSTAKEYLSEEGLKVGRSVEAGSILMTCIAGSIKSIANVAIADRKVSFNQQINAVVPKQHNTWFMYVQFMLSQEYIRSTINMSLKGILSKGTMSDLEFVFPPSELQEDFALFAQQTYKLKVEVQKSLEETQLLFDSLMQKYFD